MKKTTKGMKVTVLSIACTAFAALGFAFAKPTVASAEMNSAISTFEVVGGAAIRKSAPEGIRFTARIDKDQHVDGQTFGMVVMPTESFAGELTLNTPDVLDIPADMWVDEDAYEVNKFDVDYDYYTAVVSDESGVFPEQYYNVLLSARGYVTDGTGTYYTDTVSVRSIAYVAKMAQLANEDDPDGKIAKIAPKAEVALSKDEIALEYGATDELALYIGNVKVEANETANISVEYSSSNDRIVSVDQDGKLTSKHSGSASVNVTLTVDGGTPLVKTARVTVGRPEITSLDESLVQEHYDSVFVEGANSIEYVENVTVGNKTLAKALHVHSDTTSYGGGDAANAGHYFTLPASVIQQAVEAGYTNVRIEYYSMAGMRGYANVANSTAHFDDTFGRTEYASLSQTVALSKFVSGETYLNFVMGYFHNYDKNVYDGSQATDVYITEMYFYGKTDFVGDYLSLNDMETFTKGKGIVMSYEENVTVNDKTFDKTIHVHIPKTVKGSQASMDDGTYFVVPNTVIAAAINAGYTHLKMTIYTQSGGKFTVGGKDGEPLWFLLATETQMRELSASIDLSKFGANQMLALFNHDDIYGEGVASDVYITEMIFTGSVKGDLVRENNLSDLIAGHGVTISYEENLTTVDGITIEKAYHVHSNKTSYGSTDAYNNGHYLNISADLLKTAVAAGYTGLTFEWYTLAGVRGYASYFTSVTLLWDSGINNRTEFVMETRSVNLSQLAKGDGTYNTVCIGFFHNYDNVYDGSQPTDLYITSIQFTK